jgi:PAS domain S-box-containing protein
MDFIYRIFDPSGFPPRWQCGSGWSETPWLGWVHVISDIGIWSAYFTIPLVLGLFIVRKKDLPFRKILFLFGAFILLCGLTHLMEAAIFWWPGYRLAAALKAATAVVSWGTVLALFPVVPVVLALRSPEELEREIDARRTAEARLQQSNDELERRVDDRTRELLKAVEDLSAERELLKTTLRSIGDGVIVTDASGNVTFVNGVGERLTGWTIGDANGVNLQEVFRIVNETTREPVANPAIRALEEGVIVGLANHTLLISRDGTERPIDDSAAPIRNDRGIVGAVLVFRDISERKAAELAIEQSNRQLAEANQSLRHSEAGLQLALAIAGMGTFEIDLATDVVTVNDQGRFIYGWSQDESLTFAKIQSHFYDEDRPVVLERVSKSLDPAGSGEFELEQRIVRTDGAIRWIRVRGRAFFSEGMSKKIAVRLVGTYLDVTDPKENEAALRYQHDLTRTITDNATTAIFMVNAENRCTFMNPAAELMTGHAFRDIKGQTLHELIHHHHIDGTAFAAGDCPLHRALPEHEEVRDREDMFIRKNGEFFPVLCNAHVIYERGEAVGTVIEVRDITDIKEARENLKASEAKFRQIADAMPQIVWVSHADGVYEYFNRRWYEYTGRSDDGGVPDSSSTFHPDDRSRALARWRYCLSSGEPYEMQYRLRHHSGLFRWFLGRALPVRDESGKISKWFGTCTDIEDYKQLETERHKFVSLVENSTDFIGFCDLQGVPTYINKAGLNLVGLSSIQEARQASLKDFIHVDDQESLVPAFLQTLDDQGHGEIEMRIRHFRSQDPLWMICNVFPLTDQDGAHAGLATVSRDISNRRELENELRELATNLSEADRRKDEFLATLAHELRNPLAPIRNGLQVLKLAESDRTVIEQTRTMMERQLSQMVRLVDDLLDVSRITRNKLDLRKSCVDLHEIIVEALETSRPLIEASGHELRIDLPTEPILLLADSTRLAQVFSNLLNNAAKYTERGGKIWLSVVCEHKEVAVCVRDTGIGIPASMLNRIFDMFTQVDRTLERTQGGLGIGLTLVRRLVELHGGTVNAHSPGEGLGSEFTVRLPLVGEQEVAPIAELRPSPIRPSLLKILIADDNVDAANTLAIMLRLMNHVVETVYDGRQAVDAYATMKPDVVILDIGMPEMNGYEAAKAIRQQSTTKPVTLVALTGWGQEEDRRRSQAAGFDHHLVKPADLAFLNRLLVEAATKLKKGSN